MYGAHTNDFSIYLNGNPKVFYHHRNQGSSIEYNNISPQGVLKLSKGDTVHIYMSGKFFYASDKSYCERTYFQGHLIDLL